jgi:hypothetical protein
MAALLALLKVETEMAVKSAEITAAELTTTELTTAVEVIDINTAEDNATAEARDSPTAAQVTDIDTAEVEDADSTSAAYDADIKAAIKRSLEYLRNALLQWHPAAQEGMGFEIVTPYLLQALEDHGVMFEFPEKSVLTELYKRKMKLSGGDRLYGEVSSLLYSLEGFGANLHFDRLKKFQTPYGGYGCSPASTAGVLMSSPTWDEKAASWLRSLSERSFDGTKGGIPTAHPIDTFEYVFVIRALLHFGKLPLYAISKSLRVRLLKHLHACIGPEGAAFSRYGGIPADADCTSLSILGLHLLNEQPSDTSSIDTYLETLMTFERPTHFACYGIETAPSVSVNANVLSLLLALPTKRRAALNAPISKITGYLLDTQDAAGFWPTDRYHVSPYYGTVSACLALKSHPDPAVRQRLRRTAKWLIQEQRADGGWGSSEATTMEETAFAVLILQSMKAVSQADGQAGDMEVSDALRRGRVLLERMFKAMYPDKLHKLPKLWWAKQLYLPVRIVVAFVLAALMHE